MGTRKMSHNLNKPTTWLKAKGIPQDSLLDIYQHPILCPKRAPEHADHRFLGYNANTATILAPET